MNAPEPNSNQLQIGLLSKQRVHLKMAIKLSLIYHERLEYRFGAISQWCHFLNILLGSGAALNVLQAVGESTWRQIVGLSVGGIVVVINAAILAFRVSEKMSEHRDLRREYAKLWSRLNVDGIANDADYARFEREIAALEDREPPPNEKLLLRAEREAAEILRLKSLP